jgi:NTE family protein
LIATSPHNTVARGSARVSRWHRLRHASRWAAAGLIAIATCVQAADEAQRPRVGLVLGGGGARGAAHIGVLEVLQQLRVPVDCVVGTSMGGLVTGVFAAGLTPAEMREALAKADWDDMFKDSPAFNDMSYRNKRISQLYLPGTEVGITSQGLTIAPGAVAGQKIKAFFNQLVRADRGELTIENLPLPVSLVATDIGNGGRVVMREGSLTQAMRASMSVPGLMSPVERDGHKLVDGGLVDNVPIREARERCNPDVVIAINVGSPLLKPEEVNSLLSVSLQMVNILTEQNVTQSLATLKPTDIYIKPDLEGITSGDFGRSSETADRGHAAAEAAADQLKRLSVSEAQYAAWRRSIDAPNRPSPRVDAIEIAGLRRVNPAVVEGQISQPVGQPLDTPALNADLLRVYGEGYYENVDYTLLRERDRNILRVTPVEKSWGPDYLRFGLGFQGDRAGSIFSVRAAYHKTWMNAFGAELLAGAELGNTKNLSIDYYQPLDPAQRVFIEPFVLIQRQNSYVYQNDQRIAEVQVDMAQAELAAGLRFTNYGQAKLGWRQTHKTGETIVGPQLLDPFKVTTGGPFVNIDLDQLDRIYNPLNGWGFAAEYFAANGGGYSRLGTSVRLARQISADWVVQSRLSYQGSPIGQLPLSDVAKLGGFLNLSAFADGQLLGDDASYGNLRLERIIGRLPLGLRGDMRVGLALEAGRFGTLYTETNRTGWQNSVGLYLGGETPIGPVYVGFAKSPSSGYSNAFVIIGIVR